MRNEPVSDRISIYARDVQPGDQLSQGIHQWLALGRGELKTINNSVIIVWLRGNVGDILTAEYDWYRRFTILERNL
jgi:hypothetical protein